MKEKTKRSGARAVFEETSRFLGNPPEKTKISKIIVTSLKIGYAIIRKLNI